MYISKYKIGDRFTIKCSRDSFIYKVENIKYIVGQEPEYELRCESNSLLISISESVLDSIYLKFFFQKVLCI